MGKKKTKSVVMIGGFGHEGFSTTVQSLGYELVPLSLDNVTPKTWLKRATMVDNLQQTGSLIATVFYLHSTLFLRASANQYREAFMSILEKARPSRMIVFVFQDNLDGIFAMRHGDTREPMTLSQLQTCLDEVDPDTFQYVKLQNAVERLADYQNRKDEVENFIHFLYNSGAEVSPFLQRSDVTIRLQEFLSDLEQGVFLRLFVPNDRLQADQLKGLLAVLERYLRQVERQDFSIDSSKSEKGVVYIFKANAKLSDIQSLNDAFGRFDSFMKLCGDDASQAESILKSQGVSQTEAVFLVDRYAKDYRRLILDTKHEFERKTLSLRQKLETDVVEGSNSPVVSWASESLPSLLSVAASGGNIAVNIGTVSVVNANKIHTEIEQMVNGSITYNEHDKQLLDLFSRYADRLEALQCRSDLDQLKDATTQETARQNAKQRLTGFLRKAALKAGQVAEKVAVEALSKYLESLLKG